MLELAPKSIEFIGIHDLDKRRKYNKNNMLNSTHYKTTNR